ncbi:unnamed protein product [Miscanthus lutarioriparius]|uniref:Uncharacterized protein n=1 Tax=Miscanthus lutarioriparius TaxID=422564 RepID=A0A811MLG8_9POAL|nr:unnamed protein product [Miscanthus lutarioriparius]
MKPEAVAASKSGSSSSSTVAFSWEHEPGVSEQSPAEDRTKPTAGPGAARAEAEVSRRTPASAKKQVTAHPHCLRVPPPPGGPGAPAASPPGRRKPRSSRRVRPSEDPFLAAYQACMEDAANDGGRGYSGAQKLLGWAGLGLGTRGLGLSCKSSCGAVEECVVRLAKIPGLDED